jgi:lysophospholipase L1-like esterase
VTAARRTAVVGLTLLVCLQLPLSASTGTGAAPPPPHLLVALGDSITSGWGSGLDPTGAAIGDDNQAASWATGSDPAVDSHARRVATLFGAAPVTVNAATAGAKVTDPGGIVAQVARAPAGTDYAMIETGSADLCASNVTSVDRMTQISDFKTAIETTLRTVTARFPDAHILVASIPNWYGLWQSFPPFARPTSACPLLFSTDSSIANPGTRMDLAQRTLAYNQALSEACASFPACRYDNGAVYSIPFQPSDVSSVDHFHPSVAGQAKIAAATWAVGWWGGDFAPSNVSPPTIGGVASVGQLLTATGGSWSASPAPTLAYQWLRCAASGSGCAVITGANVSTYRLAPVDAGSTVKVQVTASNTNGSTDAVSAPTAVVLPAATAPPVSLSLPSITGITEVGQTLTASTGTWSKAPTFFSGQWLRCPPASSACADIPQATVGAYTLTGQDVGAGIRFRLTAYNAAGSTSATSARTAAVTPPTRPLSIDVVFENPSRYTVTVDHNGVSYGTSSSTGDPRYRLYRSFDEGRTWSTLYDFPDNTAIAGAISVLTDNTLIAAVNEPDAMHLFRSADGGASWTDVFQFLPDYQILSAHSITDDGTYVYVGSYNVLDTSDHVNWIWRSSDDGQTWSVVRTTTTRRHIHFVQVDPRTRSLYAAYGDSPAQSALERSTDHGVTWETVCSEADCAAVDIAFDPSGFAIFGTDNPTRASFVDRLDLATGALTSIAGLPGASYSALNLGGGVWLVGETHERGGVFAPGDSSVHLFGSADGGRTFVDVLQRPVTDPSGSAGLQVQFAFPSGDFPIAITQAGAGTLVARVRSARPINTGGPTVSGGARVGSMLTAAAGSWTGQGALKYAYQWQRCPVGGICADVAGATAATYQPGPGDVGSLVRVRVAAASAAGSTYAFSPPTGAIAEATLTVTSSIVEGQRLTGNVLWTAVLSNASRPVARVLFMIDGGVAWVDQRPPYVYGDGRLDTTRIGDGPHDFTVVVALVDGTTATVAARAVVANTLPPINKEPPRLVGLPFVGLWLAASQGTWSNGPTSYEYRWERCDGGSARCTEIPGARTIAYRIAPSDVGFRLRVAVTARNAAGAVEAASDPTRPVDRLR